MSWADWLIIGVCLASGAFGFWRGFAKEIVSLATWLAAIWLAWRFGSIVEPLLGVWEAAPELRVWAARLVVFIAVLVAGGLLAWLVRGFVRHSFLTGTDRSLGALFGVARGVIIVGLGVIGMQFAGLDQDPWWQGSKLRPTSNQVADAIRYYAELGGSYLAARDEDPTALGETPSRGRPIGRQHGVLPTAAEEAVAHLNTGG